MATFRAFAEVLEPDDPSVKAFAAGILKKHPGEMLKNVLKRTGGLYDYKLYFAPEFREQVRQVARLTSDEELLAIAELPELLVSLHHLRDVDPDTRIMIRAVLTYGPGESERLGLGSHQYKLDPSNTLVFHEE
jgi:hypothetical protein